MFVCEIRCDDKSGCDGDDSRRGDVLVTASHKETASVLTDASRRFRMSVFIEASIKSGKSFKRRRQRRGRERIEALILKSSLPFSSSFKLSNKIPALFSSSLRI